MTGRRQQVLPAAVPKNLLNCESSGWDDKLTEHVIEQLLLHDAADIGSLACSSKSLLGCVKRSVALREFALKKVLCVNQSDATLKNAVLGPPY